MRVCSNCDLSDTLNHFHEAACACVRARAPARLVVTVLILSTIHTLPAHEQLLKLKGLMKTASGRRLAEARHTFMQDFLLQFQSEAGL